MSRSRRKTPICGITSAESESEDKALWHRAHRRIERSALKHEGEEYLPQYEAAHSSTWLMDKDGKQYFDAARHPEIMRK